jgi:hypothetical protein
MTSNASLFYLRGFNCWVLFGDNMVIVMMGSGTLHLLDSGNKLHGGWQFVAALHVLCLGQGSHRACMARCISCCHRCSRIMMHMFCHPWWAGAVQGTRTPSIPPPFYVGDIYRVAAAVGGGGGGSSRSILPSFSTMSPTSSAGTSAWGYQMLQMPRGTSRTVTPCTASAWHCFLVAAPFQSLK